MDFAVGLDGNNNIRRNPVHEKTEREDTIYTICVRWIRARADDQYLDHLREGSYTVELAGIMGILLFVIFMLIYMDFDYQSQASLRIAGYELAVTAAMENYSEKNCTAEGRKFEIERWNFPTIGNVFWKICSEGKNISVNVYARSRLEALRSTGDVQKNMKYKKEDPVDWIRNTHMVNEWKEMITK